MFKGRKNCGSKHSFAVNLKYCQNEMNKNRVTWFNSRESVFQTQWKLNKYPNPSRDLYDINLSRCPLDVRLLPFRILKSVLNDKTIQKETQDTGEEHVVLQLHNAEIWKMCWENMWQQQEYFTSSLLTSVWFPTCTTSFLENKTFVESQCCLPHNER